MNPGLLAVYCMKHRFYYNKLEYYSCVLNVPQMRLNNARHSIYRKHLLKNNDDFINISISYFDYFRYVAGKTVRLHTANWCMHVCVNT